MKTIRRRVKLETGEVVAAAARPAGSLKRLELSGISSEDFQKIQTDFADTEKISAVWPREFDSQGISVIDVETLLAFNASGVGTTAPLPERMATHPLATSLCGKCGEGFLRIKFVSFQNHVFAFALPNPCANRNVVFFLSS